MVHIVHEIVAVCGVCGYVPTVWLAPLFPLRAESIVGLQTFQFPIQSLDNSRCFFESIVESIFDCTGKYADHSCRWILFTLFGNKE